MRLAFLLPFSLLLTGCTAVDPAAEACRSIVAGSVVDEVYEADLLIDNRSLLLSLRLALMMERVDGACEPIAATDVRAGDRVGHDAEAILLSYPGQANPDHVVVERQAASGS